MDYTKAELEKAYQAGNKLKFLFFWGHQKHPSGEVTGSCFSQWWPSKFSVDGVTYPTTEHWMMAEKARLFADFRVLDEVLKAGSPGKAKQLGREVVGFNQDIWNEKRFDIVVKGNYHKFSQNPELRAFLINTKNRILVEASPVDKIWGIGLEAADEFATVPPKWKGLNLLGFALMKVRDLLNTGHKL
ncbi:NADAR family protein [uncultured Imperialibacter sp.]|uniref:NADAR family protein n=1 Tax=uncultured Imperialibacter sp. TaxID=1672639 RepID=UPI0030D8C575|tara:strand:- start:23856 stop:24416 length:561 start_codon:yes stop_codon:yes gene_type:complete